MRRLSPAETKRMMRELGMTPQRPVGYDPRQTALGDYGQDDPNTGHHPLYNEGDVFRAVANPEGNVAQFAAPQQVVRNRNSFTMYPFSIVNAPVAILPSNERRNFLLIQNQSGTDDLLFNLSGDAGPNNGVLLVPGAGVFFDIVCPYNGLSIAFPAASTNQPGCVVEGAPLT